MWICFHLQFIPASPFRNHPATFTSAVLSGGNSCQHQVSWRMPGSTSPSPLALSHLIANLGTPLPAAAQDARQAQSTATPIQACDRHHRREPHLRPRFRHLQADAAAKPSPTCSPKGIVNADGTPGPNFSLGQPVRCHRFQCRTAIRLSPPDNVDLPRAAPGACRRLHHPAVPRCRDRQGV